VGVGEGVGVCECVCLCVKVGRGSAGVGVKVTKNHVYEVSMYIFREVKENRTRLARALSAWERFVERFWAD
jgi:hypothetical protein